MKHILRFLLILFTAFSISSCAGHFGFFHYTHTQTYTGAPQKIINVWIDNSFGDADRIAINDAIMIWNFALNGHIKFAVIEDYYTVPTDPHQGNTNSDGLLIMKITAHNPDIPLPKSQPTAFGFVDVIGGNHIYVVRERLQNEQIFGLTLHELGHILGLKHTTNDDDLMYQYYSDERNECIDFDTIRSISAYQHIPVNELNYCIKE